MCHCIRHQFVTLTSCVIADELTEGNVQGYLDGLRCLHNSGYVHCDIEPRHLCRSGAGRPAIIDLGEARALEFSSDSPKRAWTYRGTPCMHEMHCQHPLCIIYISDCCATSRLSCMSLMSAMLYIVTQITCVCNRTHSRNLALLALVRQAGTH